jgi:hypothetical protein
MSSSSCLDAHPAHAMSRSRLNNHRPRFNLTPNIARRGSLKAVGWPKFGLNRLSVASPSSAVSLSALSLFLQEV